MTWLSTRMAWYRLPELVMAVFALGSAFAVLVLTAVAHHCAWDIDIAADEMADWIKPEETNNGSD